MVTVEQREEGRVIVDAVLTGDSSRSGGRGGGGQRGRTSSWHEAHGAETATIYETDVSLTESVAHELKAELRIDRRRG